MNSRPAASWTRFAAVRRTPRRSSFKVTIHHRPTFHLDNQAGGRFNYRLSVETAGELARVSKISWVMNNNFPADDFPVSNGPTRHDRSQLWKFLNFRV